MRATHGHREPSSTRMDDAGLGGRSRALVDEDGTCGAGGRSRVGGCLQMRRRGM